jgi:hypothetical protein
MQIFNAAAQYVHTTGVPQARMNTDVLSGEISRNVEYKNIMCLRYHMSYCIVFQCILNRVWNITRWFKYDRDKL